MMRLLVALLAFSIATSTVADAQLGGIERAAKKALKETLGDDDNGGDENAEESEAPQVKQGSSSRPPAKKDADRKYAPGLSFSSLLNGVSALGKNGKFSLNQIQCTFIPDGCPGGYVLLRTADGKELYQYDWTPDRLQKPYTLLNFMKRTDLQSGETAGGGGIVLKPGAYVLDFYLPDEHYYTYPFTLEQVGGDDPYGDGQCYVTKGDWDRWGYLYYREAKPDQNLEWKVWLRNDQCNEKDIKVRIEIARDADSKLICTSRPRTTNSVQPAWTRLAFGMIFPEDAGVPHGTYFKAKDLLNTDGAYTLTMKIDEKPYGVWKFEIEGGKPKHLDRAARGSANPLTYIDGGRDAFWYAKEKN